MDYERISKDTLLPSLLLDPPHFLRIFEFYVLARAEDSVVIDTTAGRGYMWRSIDVRYRVGTLVLCDVRREEGINVLCDMRYMPFRDSCADFIICDPPFALHKSREEYGMIGVNELSSMLRGGNKEFSRVLREDGLLIVRFGDVKLGRRYEPAEIFLHRHLTNFQFVDRIVCAIFMRSIKPSRRRSKLRHQIYAVMRVR